MIGDARNEVPARRFAWLTPGVRGIGAASLLADVGHEIPTSLLPRFLVGTLGASAAALGIIEGVADGLAGLARLAGGALADDPDRRRKTAIGGYASTAILTSAVALADSVWQVGVLRTLGWTARGLRVPARNALLADAAPRETYGRAYGFERAMDNLGAIIGPLAAIGLVAVVSIRTAILISVVPGMFAALAILYAIRHIPRAKHADRQPIRLRVRPVLQAGLGRLMLAVSAFEIGNVAATMLILRATALLVPGYGERSATLTALLLYVGYNVAATATSVVAGHASDRVGPAWVLRGGAAAFLLAYVVFAVPQGSALLLGLGFAVAGIGIGCMETAEHVSVATAASPAIRGSAFGLLAAVQSFGNLAASAVAGILWTVISPVVAFIYVAGWMLVALATVPPDHPSGDDAPVSEGDAP